MAFTRLGGAFPASALQRANCKHPFSNFFLRMSSHTSPTQPPEMEPPRSARRYVFGAAVGGLLTCCGLGFAYKTYTDENFGLSNKFKWIGEKIGWEEPNLDDKLALQQKPDQIAKFSGLENQASCAAKDECPPQCEESTCLRKMDKEEEMIAKANAELEKALKDVKPKAMEATEAALKAYCEAADLIKLFMDKAYCAIEQDTFDSPQFEEVWCGVYEAALKRCEKVKEAMAKGQCAWELLCRLREVIENGKTCKYTQCNPLLITAEEALLCAERELLNAKARVDCIQSESRLVEQYRNLVEDFRRDLKAEVESMLTGNPECKATFTDNECAMILTHAYKKVLRVQKELSQVQINGVREYYEEELLKALVRQAQVYQENFAMVKAGMEEEFRRMLMQKSDIARSQGLVEIMTRNQQTSDALDVMELALTERKNYDDKTENLRKLWTYCNTLYCRIQFANYSTGDARDKIVLNKEHLLKEFCDDEFAMLLLRTIPEVVETCGGLKERFFNKIDKTCREVAIFRDEGKITLWKYLVGCVQGILTTRCDGSKVASRDVYELLDKTGYNLSRGEILDAVSTLRKMNGIPRQVCEDWVKDAVSFLEASQTLYALMTHVSASCVAYQKSSTI